MRKELQELLQVPRLLFSKGFGQAQNPSLNQAVDDSAWQLYARFESDYASSIPALFQDSDQPN